MIHPSWIHHGMWLSLGSAVLVGSSVASGADTSPHSTSPPSPVITAEAPEAPIAQVAPPAAITPTTITPPADQTAIDQHLHELAHKIEQLEQRLGQGQGRGALRRGTSFVVEGGGQESVLERLRRVERELQQTRTTLAGREAALAELREQSDQARQRAQGLSEKVDSLAQVRDHLTTAQQTLAERQAIIDQLNQRLSEAELARLRVERTYFLLASTVLRLVPGQGQDLVDLQEQVRQQAKILQPLSPGMNPSSAKDSP